MIAAESVAATGSTPKSCDRFVRAESAKFAKIIKDAGIRAE